MVCFDLSILLARRSNINMWKGDNQEGTNLADLCKCHLSCDNQGICGRSRYRGRPTTMSLGTVSVTSGCKVEADGRNKRREGCRCGSLVPTIVATIASHCFCHRPPRFRGCCCSVIHHYQHLGWEISE
ncbi:hypothetical protein CMV_011813 [Castanea mollissima]|uniref:Uncharacterized protein n=1 Tax=Castanea mollissima TaxID=60419 RepID=A0A8J4VKB6_9ROSI|nr:hypothetical protein CMV_011813 [Castanea mollissima]